MLSINSDDETWRIDVFACADGSHGFKEYYLGPKDPHGWFPIGEFMDLRFTEKEEALARARIDW